MRLHLSVTTLWSLLTIALLLELQTSQANPTGKATTPKPHLTTHKTPARATSAHPKQKVTHHTTPGAKVTSTTPKLNHTTNSTTPTTTNATPTTTNTTPTTNSTTPTSTPTTNSTTSTPKPTPHFTESEEEPDNSIINQEEREILHLIGNYGFGKAIGILEGRLAKNLKEKLTDEDRSKIRLQLLKAIFDFHILKASRSSDEEDHTHNISKITTTTTKITTTTTKKPKPIHSSESSEEVGVGHHPIIIVAKRDSKKGAKVHNRTKSNNHGPLLATTVTRSMTANTRGGAQVTSETMEVTHLHSKPISPEVPASTIPANETQVTLKKDDTKSAIGKCPTFNEFLISAKELWDNLLQGNGFVSSLTLVVNAWIHTVKSLGICFFSIGTDIWNLFFNLFKSS